MKTRYLPFVLAILTSVCSHEMNKKAEIEKRIEKYGLKSSYVTIDNLNIHYMEKGKGDALILIHGWIAWGGFWKGIVPALSDSYHVYALDLIGHGMSDKQDKSNIKYTTESQAEMIIKFMDRLSIKKAFLIGHSMGGEIAAKVTIKRPDRIKKLILVSATGLKNNKKYLPLILRLAGSLKGKSIGAKIVAKLAFKKGALFACKRFVYYSKNPVNEDMVSDILLVNLGDEVSRKAFVKVTQEGLFHDFIDDRAGSISIPTLLIWGKFDRLSPAKIGKQYNRLIPNSRLHIIDKAGHVPSIEKPEEFIKTVMGFLSN